MLVTLHVVRRYEAKFALWNMIRDELVFMSGTVNISIFECGI